LKILGLIPARGGSKGIPRKNIRPIAGKPLIAWSIDAALGSSLLAGVMVSTDDADIAAAARELGALTPFLRPAALAQDTTPGVDPVLHALQELPAFDAVMLLQPTSPLRTRADIDACIEHAQRLQAPCVVSVCEPDQHPGWMYTINARQQLRPVVDGQPVTRRQDLPQVFAANGALYFAHRDWLQRTRTFIAPDTVAFVMPRERSIDLDTLFDWKIAEMLLQETRT
jgi:CMP-N,N'-diacetyllegionaminic acid synthase